MPALSVTMCEVCSKPLGEHNRHDRYNHSEKGRARWLRYYDKRMMDPDPVARWAFRVYENERKRVSALQASRAASNVPLPVYTGLRDAMRKTMMEARLS